MAVIVIPARLNSTRIPQKLIQRIDGREVLLHLCDRIAEIENDHRIIISTDSTHIEDIINEHTSLAVVLSKERFRNGTERCAWTTLSYDPDEIIINIQGDEMMCDPKDVALLISSMEDKHDVNIATLVGPVTKEQYENRSVVKAQVDENLEAVDFVRIADPESKEYYSHVGVYAYRNSILQTIAKLPISQREREYSLEQLRWIDAGYRIHGIKSDNYYPSVNTLSDLKLLRELHMLNQL